MPDVILTFQIMGIHVGFRKVGNRVAARFKEEGGASLSAIQVRPNRARMRRRNGRRSPGECQLPN